MLSIPRASLNSCISAASRHAASLSISSSALHSKLLTKAASSSAASFKPLLTTTLHQKHQEKPPTFEPEANVKPYSDIPKTKTFLGLNMDILRDPTRLAQYVHKQTTQLGPIYRLTGMPGLQDMVCLTDPADVETVYRAGDSSHPRRFPIPEWVDARNELKKPMGLFLADGEEWHKNRLPISKFIMMPRKMAEYYEPFNQVTADYIDLIRRQRQQDNLFCDVALSMNKWSLESVSLFVLGKRMGCLEDEMPEDCKNFVDNIHKFIAVSAEIMLGIPFHKLWRTKKWERLIESLGAIFDYTESHVNQKIKEIEEESEDDELHAEAGMDFLTYMISSGKLSVHDIAMDAIDVLTAGVDTTAMTMAACLYSLGRHGEVQEKLRREVQDVVGKEELVTPQHIQNMPYLRDTIKETMRLYPVAPNNSRILTEDVVLSGFKVPAETYILMPVMAAGRDPSLFPEPNSFKPERWDRGNKQLPNSFSSLPFGYGRRGCIGRRVAELEMHVLLSQLVRNFKIEYLEEKPMDFHSKLFYTPARQMDLAFTDIN